MSETASTEDAGRSAGSQSSSGQLPTDSSSAPIPPPTPSAQHSGTVSSPSLLFYGTFEHGGNRLNAERTDQIHFKEAVAVTAVRVVRMREQPHSNIQFEGASTPAAFDFRVFALNLERPLQGTFRPISSQLSFFENAQNPTFFMNEPVSRQTLAYHEAPIPFLYFVQENAQKQVVTNHLVVRGTYQRLSICIYGVGVDFQSQPRNPRKVTDWSLSRVLSGAEPKSKSGKSGTVPNQDHGKKANQQLSSRETNLSPSPPGASAKVKPLTPPPAVSKSSKSAHATRLSKPESETPPKTPPHKQRSSSESKKNLVLPFEINSSETIPETFELFPSEILRKLVFAPDKVCVCLLCEL